jgi:DNA repair photolyase
VKPVNVEAVKRLFLLQEPSQFTPWLAARRVVQWGGLADAFDWYERRYRVSLDLLRFFRALDYPISISTKATWFLDDPEYRAVIAGYTNLHIKYSIITADDHLSRLLEPGVPPSSERFAALREFRDLGVGGVTLRFRPFIPGAGDTCIEEMVEAAAAAGADSVTSEYLCLERRASAHVLDRYRKMSAALGFDLYAYYVQHTPYASGLLRLNYELKRPTFEALRDAARRHGLRFYISDAHHKGLSDGFNCCGTPHCGALAGGNRGQFLGALLIARERGLVRWADIAQDAAWMDGLLWRSLQAYNHGNTKKRARHHYQTALDFMHHQWNRTESLVSPARYFGGVLVPADLDAHGDVIYLYNRPLVEEGRQAQSVEELKTWVGYECLAG